MFVSMDDARSGCAAGLAARGALRRTARLAGRLAAFFVERRALRAEAARRDALFFFRAPLDLRERPDLRDILRLLLRDLDAVFAVFRRFLAMRVPPGEWA